MILFVVFLERELVRDLCSQLGAALERARASLFVYRGYVASLSDVNSYLELFQSKGVARYAWRRLVLSCFLFAIVSTSRGVTIR
jgi:hypothetical protein